MVLSVGCSTSQCDGCGCATPLQCSGAVLSSPPCCRREPLAHSRSSAGLLIHELDMMVTCLCRYAFQCLHAVRLVLCYWRTPDHRALGLICSQWVANSLPLHALIFLVSPSRVSFVHVLAVTLWRAGDLFNTRPFSSTCGRAYVLAYECLGCGGASAREVVASGGLKVAQMLRAAMSSSPSPCPLRRPRVAVRNGCCRLVVACIPVSFCFALYRSKEWCILFNGHLVDGKDNCIIAVAAVVRVRNTGGEFAAVFRGVGHWNSSGS